MKIILAALACALLLNLAEARPAKKEVRIYFGSTQKEDCGKDNLFCIEPVARMVDSRSPALGAMKALIAGPTAEEKSKGFYAPYTENLSIKRVVIARGTAQVSLRTTRKAYQRWPGDMAPGRFTAAIEKTLRQFPGVRRVTICLDGYADFASERGGPRKRCN